MEKFKKSESHILSEALTKIAAVHADQKLHGLEVQKIKDDYGLVGYAFWGVERYVLVAKPYLYEGKYVSCHKRAVAWRALKREEKIVFYIKKNNSFYIFDPAVVFSHPLAWSNRRGDIEMLNFPVSLGRKIKPVDLFQKQLELAI